MSNLPNPELWAKFVEAVKAGRIDALTTGLVSRGPKLHSTITNREHLSVYVLRVNDTWEEFTPGQSYDALWAELRRWILSKGFSCFLAVGGELNIGRWYDAIDPVDGQTRQYVEPNNFDQGNETDWHLAAALWVIEQEGEGQ